MKVAILPFYSAQDKQTREFLLRKCCTTHISAFLARKFIEVGCEVHVPLPQGFGGKAYGDAMGIFPKGTSLRSGLDTPPDNLLQRLTFDAANMRELVKDADLVISHSEVNSARIKQVMKSDAFLIQFNHLMPVGVNAWMKDEQMASWRAADAVVFLSPLLKRFAHGLVPTHLGNYWVWPMCYSEEEAVSNLYKWGDGDPAVPTPTYDFLFPHRASANNYTHHTEYLEAIKHLNDTGGNQPEPGWQPVKTLFLDPTGYLRQTQTKVLEGLPGEFALAMAEDRKTFWHSLASCRVVFGLMESDLHGGIALREAVRAGCFPVLLDTPAYRQFAEYIGCDFLHQYMVEKPTPEAIHAAMLKVLADKPYRSQSLTYRLSQGIEGESFDFGWNRAATNIVGVFSTPMNKWKELSL